MSTKVVNQLDMKSLCRVYHYTNIDTVPLILRDDKIHLRMTHVEYFDDKHEWRKTIEIYYDLALERLLHDDIIDCDTYAALSRIEVPEKTVFILPPSSSSTDTSGIVCNTECDVYIACFSSEKNSL